MCGIGVIASRSSSPVPHLSRKLEAINYMQAHRGPDDKGLWVGPNNQIGLAHCRLKIIDPAGGAQPMADEAGNQVTYNGAIYNFKELREELGVKRFKTISDTEVILRAWETWGEECVEHFRGMFAFALWDEKGEKLFCARDHFGIKPLYYAQVGDLFVATSEVKGLLPFFDQVEPDQEGLADYLTFQFMLGGKTLFKNVWELPPGHTMTYRRGEITTRCYWDVTFEVNNDATDDFYEERLRAIVTDSIQSHLVSDVPVGSYVSGGIDSSLIASLAARSGTEGFAGFHGRFPYGSTFDESGWAKKVAENAGFPLHQIDITPDDFIETIESVIYHLDYPVAGPGSFPQYLVSRLASQHVKVALGGQGGDEIFGGYTRYLVAYFEQCIKGAINGDLKKGPFVVTYESIIPNLAGLKNYKPMLQGLLSEGVFTEEMDRRYFRLIDRSHALGNEVRWDLLADGYSPYDSYRAVFHSGQVGHEAYFDLMTRFDFKTLLPALLQVEDRMSMAHGLESRVPFLDRSIVELAATMPATVKFKNGDLKHILKKAMRPDLPTAITDRTDKMGFPVPLTDWMKGPLRNFIGDIFSSQAASTRTFIDNQAVFNAMEQEGAFGRKTWGFLSLELWQRRFLDQSIGSNLPRELQDCL